MPTFYQRIQSALKAFSQNTSPEYNRAVYSYIGNGNISNNENDDNYIRKGYQKNPTIYSLINLMKLISLTLKFSTTTPYHFNDTTSTFNILYSNIRGYYINNLF